MNDDDSNSVLTSDSVTTDENSTVEEAMKDPTYRDVFKNREFMKLLTGQFFSNFGDAIFRMSIQFYVYALTGSATAMTLILAAQTVPWIIIGPFAGVFADRVSRKAIMVGADIVRGISILFLPLLTFISTSETTMVYGIAVIAFILGAASATFVAPRSAAIPEITGMKLYVKAISLSQLIFQTLAIIGPLIAAPIYLLLGEQTFWITSACYFFSAIVIFITIIPSAIRDKSEKIGMKLVLKDLKNGFVFLVKHPTVRMVIFLFTFIIIGTSFAGPLLLPYLFEIKHNAIAIQYLRSPNTIFYLKNVTHIAAHYYNDFVSAAIYFNTPQSMLNAKNTGYLAYYQYGELVNRYAPSVKDIIRSLSESHYAYVGAASAVGSVAGNLVFGRFEPKIGRSKALLFGSFAISAYYFVFFFKPGLIVLLICALGMGFFNGMMSLGVNALFAENVPNEVRGRAYSATNAYIQVLSVVCLSISGFTADSIGLIVTITGSGIFLLLTTVVITIMTKAYRFADEKPNPNLVSYE